METPKPSPSMVEGKKEDRPMQVNVMKVLLSVEGDVDLRCKYSFTTSSFSPLIFDCPGGGWRSLGAKYKYFGFVRIETVPPLCGILGYNVNH